jgi:hypothetical protein
LDFRFVLFWRKNIGAKAAHILLVKLSPAKLREFFASLLFFNDVKWEEKRLRGPVIRSAFKKKIFDEKVIFLRSIPFVKEAFFLLLNSRNNLI